MKESLRPLASEGIEEGLRTRLEGGVELLEDAMPLLDSLRALLGRRVLTDDDQLTLNECIHQLPRIDEMVDRADREAQASALVRAVREAQQAAFLAASERLKASPASLRAALLAVRESSAPPRPPRLDERVLATSAPPRWLPAIGVSALALALLWLALDFWVALALAAIVLAAMRWVSKPRPWVLLTDRLHLGAWSGKPAQDVDPADLTALQLDRGEVTAQFPGGLLTIRAEQPAALIAWLRLLQSPGTQGLEPRARPALVLTAGPEGTARALVCDAGVLVVPLSEAAQVLHRLGTLTALPLEEVLLLLAQLPAARWPAVAELLTSAGAQWFGAPGLELSEDPKAPGQFILKSGERQVRLLAAFATTDPRRAVLAALVERLTAQKA